MYNGSMYQTAHNHSHQQPLTIVKRIASRLKPGSHILDLAAGSGRHALYLAKQGHFVTAVDKSTQTLKQKRPPQTPNLTIINKDVLDFKSHQLFDLIICTGLLHFFPPKQILEIMEKIQTSTNDAGYNIIGVRMDQNPRQSLSHVFKSQELKQYYPSNWQILEYQEKVFENPTRKVQFLTTQLIR
jgi:cyclopropane fatty-acyl-phospholipid synthase-like methyltransferase